MYALDLARQHPILALCVVWCLLAPVADLLSEHLPPRERP